MATTENNIIVCSHLGHLQVQWWQWLGQVHGPLARYIKLRVAHAPRMPGTFSPPLRVSDPDMHHGTCVTRVPWCMPESLTSGFVWSRWRENVPGISVACATHNFTYLVRGPCTAEAFEQVLCRWCFSLWDTVFFLRHKWRHLLWH